MPSKIPNILVIEDEDQVRQSYEDMFSFFGYGVDSVRNGREGMSRITKKDYDIVVTDLNMPEMNGLDVLKYIKKKKPYIEVIVITGFATIENAIEAMKVGAYDYFSKPIDLEHVRIVLSKCVKQIQSRKENEELRSLTKQLKELNELKDKFITITNHELRTPVTVLKGYFELIDYYLQESRNEDINDAIDIVKETMRELVDIVERMHDISSFDYGKQKMIATDIDIQEILQLIYKEMKLLFEKRNINFDMNLDGEGVITSGDERQIKRSIRELLQNALKFTPEGGDVIMEYSINKENKKLYVKVSDNGIGIPKDKLDLVFEPFYEVQNVINHMTSKTEFMGGGIGLGLTLVKEVFESHKGELLLESEENKGTVFTVVLPFKKIKEPQKEETTIDPQ
jgi:signal transduction histidine kinase